MHHFGYEGPWSGISVVKVVGDVTKNFVDGVGKNVARSKVIEVNLVNFGRVINVVCHARRCNDEIEFEIGIF